MRITVIISWAKDRYPLPQFKAADTAFNEVIEHRNVGASKIINMDIIADADIGSTPCQIIISEKGIFITLANHDLGHRFNGMCGHRAGLTASVLSIGTPDIKIPQACVAKFRRPKNIHQDPFGVQIGLSVRADWTGFSSSKYWAYSIAINSRRQRHHHLNQPLATHREQILAHCNIVQCKR